VCVCVCVCYDIFQMCAPSHLDSTGCTVCVYACVRVCVCVRVCACVCVCVRVCYNIKATSIKDFNCVHLVMSR